MILNYCLQRAMICVTKTNDTGLPVDLIKLGEFDGTCIRAYVVLWKTVRSKLWRRQTKTVGIGERRREHIVDTVLASVPAPTTRGPRGVKLYLQYKAHFITLSSIVACFLHCI